MVGTGNGDAVVRIFKDIVLGSIKEIVEVGVKGWGVGTLVHLITMVRTELRFVVCRRATHVVSFRLEPVEGTLGTVSAVTRRSTRDTISGISTASTRELCFGQRDVRGRSGDVTLESGHVVYTPTDKRR